MHYSYKFLALKRSGKLYGWEGCSGLLMERPMSYLAVSPNELWRPASQ